MCSNKDADTGRKVKKSHLGGLEIVYPRACILDNAENADGVDNMNRASNVNNTNTDNTAISNKDVDEDREVNAGVASMYTYQHVSTPTI